MTNERELQEFPLDAGSLALNFINYAFAVLVLAIGIINSFWGNDTGFGIFIALLSLLYFLPVNAILYKYTGHYIPKMRLAKILTGIFILWTAVGVGELFEKVNLMLLDF